MRIGTITNWAYGATLLLTAVSGAAFMAASNAAEHERAAIERHRQLDSLSEELELAAELRSDEARLYIMRGGLRHLDAFRREEREIRSRERTIERLGAASLTAVEQAALTEAERNIGQLDAIERRAIEEARQGRRPAAQELAFGPDHERAQQAVLAPVTRLRALVSARTTTEIAEAQRRNDWWSGLAKALLGITAALFLGVLYFVLRRRVALPLARMTGIVTRLARQDYTVEVPNAPRRDEIGDMTQAIQVFRTNGLERDRLEALRRADQRIKDSILQMMHRLQAVQSETELAEIVARFAPQTFPGLAGNLYLLNASRTALVHAASWSDPQSNTQTFPANACWALRRARPHASHGGANDIPCGHVGQTDAATLCVPLAAQGDAIGLLYFEERQGTEPLVDTARLYLELVAENIGLALSNLRLREQLINLATRDALTGLHNRRSLDETLNRQARDPGRNPCACLMIDIDHFKQFNDQFGHDAGDHVMQHVAAILAEEAEGVGRAFRFGGEEFTLLAACGRAAAIALAERVRTRIAAMPLAHRGRVLGHISVSIGVATVPENGQVANLLTQADAALLEAKRLGRNQVVPAPVEFTAPSRVVGKT